jgi:Kef-type K+ transport system membrane component KefB
LPTQTEAFARLLTLTSQGQRRYSWTADERHGPIFKEIALKIPFAKVLITIGLAFLVWYFFYLKGMELNAQEISLVVGVCLGAVLLSDWVWTRFRRATEKK